jgi:small-conductance mechanosensitive channel
MTPTRDVPCAPEPTPRERAAAQAGLGDLSAPKGRWLVLALAGGPVAWTVHLLAGYVIVALWCAEGWAGVGMAIGVLTLLCAAGAVGAGVLSFRLWRRAQAGLLSDEEPGGPESWDARMGERGARAAFLSVMSLFLAALFLLLIVLQALPPLFAEACAAGSVP